jgi:hypothetical protein
MARYTQCPRCHNSESGYTIFRCRHCGGMWCFKGGFFTDSGCGAGLLNCPKCGRPKDHGPFNPSFKELGITAARGRGNR